MDSDSAAILLFIVGTTWFVSALLALMVLLTMLRQLRNYRVRRAYAYVPHALPQWHDDTTIARLPRENPRLRLTPMPARSASLPVREGTPEQVVLQIDPDPGPTRKQTQIQRIIKHLKEPKSASAKAGS
jgi:hypothetical protein